MFLAYYILVYVFISTYDPEKIPAARRPSNSAKFNVLLFGPFFCKNRPWRHPKMSAAKNFGVSSPLYGDFHVDMTIISRDLKGAKIRSPWGNGVKCN